MTFTYTGALDTDLEKVRLILGDTNSSNPLLTDEEITYFLSLNSNVYRAASLSAKAIAAKYSNKVDKAIEGVSVRYSQIADQYNKLALQLEAQADSASATASGPSATGISNAAIQTANEDTDRPKPAFREGMFDNPQRDSLTEDY